MILSERANTRIQVTNFNESLSGVQVAGSPILVFTLSANGTLKSYFLGGYDTAFVENNIAQQVQNIIADTPNSIDATVMEIAVSGNKYIFRTADGNTYIFKDINPINRMYNPKVDMYLPGEPKLRLYKVLYDTVRITQSSIYYASSKYAKAVDMTAKMVPLMSDGVIDTIVGVYETPSGDAILYIKNNSRLTLRLPNGVEIDADAASREPIAGVLVGAGEAHIIRKSSGSYSMRRVEGATEQGSAVSITDWGYIDFYMKPIVFNGMLKWSNDKTKDDYFLPNYPRVQFAFLKQNGTIKKVEYSGVGSPKVPGTKLLPEYKLVYTPKGGTGSFAATIPYYISGGAIRYIGTKNQLQTISKDGGDLIAYIYNNDCTKTFNIHNGASRFECGFLRGFVLNYDGEREVPRGINDISG